MTLTITLDEELASRFEERAKSERVSVDQLARQALTSFAAKQMASPPTEPWTNEKNTRRCQLIDRLISGDISAMEREDLERLQLELRGHLNRETPFDLEGARSVHRTLLPGRNGERDSV